MGKHRLPDGAYAQRLDHTAYKVSEETFERWGDRVFHQWEMTRHAACDCRSYSEHHARSTQSPGWTYGKCEGRLATIFVERHLLDALVANTLQQRMPWLTKAQLLTIACWEPGQPAPTAGGTA
jgi:hypothetical protein